MKKLIFSAVLSGMLLVILLFVGFFLFAEFVAKESCIKNRGESCLYLALSKMIEGNYHDSYTYFGEGCYAGDMEQCNISGVALSTGLNGYYDALFAYAVFDYACDSHDVKSCSDKTLLTIEASSSNNKAFLEIKSVFMLGNEEKTEKLIIEKTNEKPQLVIMILKDQDLKKTAENKRLHEHYLSLLRALKQKNESYLISAGGVQ